MIPQGYLASGYLNRASNPVGYSIALLHDKELFRSFKQLMRVFLFSICISRELIKGENKKGFQTYVQQQMMAHMLVIFTNTCV